MTSRKDFFVASCGATKAAGVYRFRLVDGTLRKIGFCHQDYASYLALSADGTILYAVLEAPGNGGLASFRVLPNGRLELLDSFQTKDATFCHLILTPDEKTVYAADYRHGTCGVFTVDNGRILSWDTPIRHSGHGPNQKRQASAHIHYAIITPDNRYLCLVDLGMDAILAYPLDNRFRLTGKPPKRTDIAPAGSGPRHLVFHSDMQTAYLVNELENTVMTLKYSDGTFAIRQILPMLPGNVTVSTKAAAIRLSPDNRFLLASNRGYDTIATYAIALDGSLAQTSADFIGASSPRDFNFLPDNKHILACGEKSRNAFLFRFNSRKGRLEPDGAVLTIPPRPQCVI